MFNKEEMKKVEKYLKYWVIWCVFVGVFLLVTDFDISDSFVSNLLRDIIPAVRKLDYSTRYPQLAVSVWTIFWLTGPFFLLFMLIENNGKMVRYVSFKLMLFVTVCMLFVVLGLYFGIWDKLPDSHSGDMSRFAHLTRPGIIFKAALVWTGSISILFMFIIVLFKLLGNICYGK